MFLFVIIFAGILAMPAIAFDGTLSPADVMPPTLLDLPPSQAKAAEAAAKAAEAAAAREREQRELEQRYLEYALKFVDPELWDRVRRAWEQTERERDYYLRRR